VSNKYKINCKYCNNPITSNNITKHEESCKGNPSWFVRNKNNLPNKVKYKKLEDYDWKKIQKYYDDNHSYRDVLKEFNIDSSFLSKAIKNKKFKTRIKYETARIRGKYDNLKLPKQQKENISKGIAKAISEGKIKFRTDGHRIYKMYYHTSWLGNVEILHAGWELKVAKFLDKHKIHWCKSKEYFIYNFEGQERRYFPDFYLKDFEVFIEVKGRIKPNDYEKWKQFPKKLLILDESHINKLDLFFTENKILHANQIQ
jgi:hypothetical protein